VGSGEAVADFEKRKNSNRGRFPAWVRCHPERVTQYTPLRGDARIAAKN